MCPAAVFSLLSRAVFLAVLPLPREGPAQLRWESCRQAKRDKEERLTPLLFSVHFPFQVLGLFSFSAVRASSSSDSAVLIVGRKAVSYFSPHHQ